MEENMKDLIVKSALIANFMMDEEPEQKVEDINISMYLFVITHSIQILSKRILNDDDRLFITAIPEIKFLITKSSGNDDNLFSAAVNTLINTDEVMKVEILPFQEELIYWAVIFFFSKNDINPFEKKKLTTNHKKELQKIYVDLVKHEYVKTQETNDFRLELLDYLCENLTISSLHPMPTKEIFYGLDAISRNLNHVENIINQNKYSTFNANFDELMKNPNIKCDGNLTPYQKRILRGAHSAFYNHGSLVTLGQIYSAMGNSGKPNKRLMNNLLEQLKNVSKVWITNNKIKTSEDKKITFKDYEGSLLPCETVIMDVNGQKCDNVIHFFREPPLMTFAKETNQYSIKPKDILEIPLNQTPDTLMIEDYLLDRIISNNMSTTIKLDTIYSECEIKSRDKKSRAKDKIKVCLDHFVKCEEIVSYKINKDSISFKRK